MERFERLRSAIAQLERPIDLLVRDDDANIDEPTLHRLLDVCSAREVPLSLAVIPGTLERGAIDLLRGYVRTHPALLELHQHGWMHQNHEPTGRPCEFGPSRSLVAQLEDIARGKARMDDAFGAAWYRAFTPPWNRCTADTFAALDILGFQALSKDRDDQPIVAYDFHEVSTSLDLYRWRGGAAIKSADEIERAIIAQLTTGQPIGLLLHHKVMDDDAFRLLAALLDALRPQTNLRWHALSWFVDASTPALVANTR